MHPGCTSRHVTFPRDVALSVSHATCCQTYAEAAGRCRRHRNAATGHAEYSPTGDTCPTSAP